MYDVCRFVARDNACRPKNHEAIENGEMARASFGKIFFEQRKSDWLALLCGL